MSRTVLNHERLDYINWLMANAPLTLPYVDFSTYDKIPDINDRATVSMTIPEPDHLTALGLEADHLPELLLCRYQASKYAFRKLNDLGISMAEAGRQCGITKSALSKYAACERPLSLEADQLIPFSVFLLRESCHKIMFGEPGRVILPGIYSSVTAAYSALSAEQKDAMLDNAKKTMEIFNRQHPAAAYSGLHRDGDILIRERLWSYVKSLGSTPIDFLGDRQGSRIRNAIRIYLEADIERPNTGFRNLRILFTLFLCKETGLALDYFIRENFADYVPIYYKNFDGEIVEVTDSQVKIFVGLYMSGDLDAQKQISAPVLARYMQDRIPSGNGPD